MATEFNPRLASLYATTLVARDPIPIVRGWNRLEGRPRSADFERSLRAEVRDPLWFLSRQWQYGEFEGEDAGSPIEAVAAVSTTPIERFAAGGSASAYDPATPLEVRVTREAVPFDLLLHMQAGQLFERLLVTVSAPLQRSDYLARWPLAATAIDGEPSADGDALLAAGAQHLLDARALLGAVQDGSHSAFVNALAGLSLAQKAAHVTAGRDLLTWFNGAYAQPGADGSAWRPAHLGYGFECATPAVRLAASNYRGGLLDWTDFDASPTSPANGAAPVQAAAQTLSFMPAAISFGGMPNPRFWEMESARTEFGHIDAHTNDLAKLLFTEFMLLYSNDWCVFPLELDVGTLTRVHGLLVTDVFGEQTLVRPADRGRDADWQRWSMFRLTGDDAEAAGLLLAPALTAVLEAPSVEQVHFIRDEMANMAWAVEHRVASALGEPFDPAVYNSAPLPRPTEPVAHYLLGTTVPENWRPFVPVHAPGSNRSIKLQRARLPGPDRPVRGSVLRVPGAYFIEEEEIPRAGRIVERRFERARWTDGTVFLWIGRKSISGRGEGSSGLAFDHIEEGLRDGTEV
jgi:hypothetical protein